MKDNVQMTRAASSKGWSSDMPVPESERETALGPFETLFAPQRQVGRSVEDRSGAPSVILR